MIVASQEPRIGPNAVLQIVAALQSRLGRPYAVELMRSAGLGGYLTDPPRQMIAEREVTALHSALRARLRPATACAVSRAAGLATGDYLLAARIPRLVQVIMRALPAPFAARLLLRAILRHTWTFAGSGRVTATVGRPTVIMIANCPICRDAHAVHSLCDYYGATFGRLFTRLVHRRAWVRETACLAAGATACRFEIDWE